MTSLLNIAGNVPTDAFAEGSSLRFEDGDVAYLSRTPSSAGNRKTWTWSGWVKRGNLGSFPTLFSAGTSTGLVTIRFVDDEVTVYSECSASARIDTNAKLRDVSAWYHIVVAFDTTQSTTADRIKIYINGDLQTVSVAAGTGYPSLNYDSSVNNTVEHTVGTWVYSKTSGNTFDGYIANVAFIDGTALTPTSFGEYEDTLWKPKSDTDIQALTFGTNGFYLPFDQTTEAEGFSTVTYAGNGGTQSIEGVGFEPDFVWIKSRSFVNNHHLFDTVRGAGKILRSSTKDAETSLPVLSSFDNNGFTVKETGGNNATNDSGSTFVGWAWDAGADLASTGFNAVTYVGSNDKQSISGLGFEPDLVWIKERDAVSNHGLFDSVRGVGKSLKADTTAAEQTQTDSVISFDSDGFTLGDNSEAGPDVNFTNGNNYIAWAWDAGTGSAVSNTDGSITSSVKANTTNGFSIVSYTGNGSSSPYPSVGHGLSSAPEIIFCKTRGGTANWIVYHTLVDGSLDYLNLNTADANNNAAPSVPTSSIFYAGGDANRSGEDTIAYCFHSVSGYSDFGSYTGDGTSNGSKSINLGFRPAFVMIKRTNSTENWMMLDTTRNPLGVINNNLYANLSNAESDYDRIEATNTGFDIYNNFNDINASGSTYIYMAFAGGKDLSAPLNTDGSITSRVKANTANGFSVVSYNSNASGQDTVGHGLTSTPEMIITKSRDGSTFNWSVFHKDVSDTTSKFLRLNTTDSTQTFSTIWGAALPTSSVFGITSGGGVEASDACIAYCFHSVSGYSDIGSYTGTGSSGNSITGLGFKPAWLMIKRTDGGTNGWMIYDNTRDVDDDRTARLKANASDAEDTGDAVSFDSDGFTLNATGASVNGSSNDYIYMAFADTRDATFFGDTSGNSNNWTPNKLNNTDVVPDSPVTNFATLNPLVNVTGGSFSEGNLKVTTGSSQYGPAVSSFAVSSGKWYCEFLTTASSGDQRIGGVRVGTNLTTTYDLGNSGSFAYRQNDGQKKVDGTQSAYGATWAANDIIGMALNLDDDEVTFYKNGSSQGTFSITTGEYFLATSDGDSGAGMGAFANFGQDSSFAGNETPQGNTDDNGQGDFYYAPPSGFLALNRNNLPAPDILDPADYFNTVLYTGNGSSGHAITGVGFQPDWLWLKNRTTSNSHGLYDSVRGSGTNGFYGLSSNTTNAELDSTNVASMDSDGFTLGSNAGTNGNGNALVSWNWLAGGTAVSNTDGSITSSVSANTDAGFSVVGYTGNNTSGSTIGHGLTSAPEMIIVKNRSQADKWAVYHASNTSAPETDYLVLNDSVATADATYWADTAPTSTVFSVGLTGPVNQPSENYIAYCFHSVEGYSKMGSYTGNGSTDGTYVHLGFHPSWIMLKAATGTAQHWWMFDNKREGYNVDNDQLYANLSSAEGTSDILDFVSNGFKIRTSSNVANGSAVTYIFLAFAEAPFRNANAR